MTDPTTSTPSVQFMKDSCRLCLCIEKISKKMSRASAFIDNANKAKRQKWEEWDTTDFKNSFNFSVHPVQSSFIYFCGKMLKICWTFLPSKVELKAFVNPSLLLTVDISKKKFMRQFCHNKDDYDILGKWQ